MTDAASPPTGPATVPRRSALQWVGRVLAVMGGLAMAGLVSLLLLVGVALAVAYPNLPATDSLTDYRPKLPLRVYSADGVQLAEFGEERRNFTRSGRSRRS